MREKIHEFRLQWGAAVAFLILAAAGMYAIQSQASANAQTLYHTQLASCKRGNILRQESNERVPSHELDTDVLRKFLDSASVARRHAGTATDIKAANEYLKLRDSLKDVHFKPVPLVDCDRTIQKP